jgi:DNA end-binding protein Ku
VTEVDEKEVRSEKIVKGYEYQKGVWITLKDEDFEKVKIESPHSVEITDFEEQSAINSKFFYKPYFLEPQKGGEKGYALLHRVLSETGKVGIAKSGAQQPRGSGRREARWPLPYLELMHFAQKVLEPELLKSPEAANSAPKEVEMAKALVLSSLFRIPRPAYTSPHRPRETPPAGVSVPRSARRCRARGSAARWLTCKCPTRRNALHQTPPATA